LHDVGFQLSALATLGLVLFVPPLDRQVARWLARHFTLPDATRRRVLRLTSDFVLITLAAQLITTPLIIGTFGRLPLVSLLSNLLIVPVQAWLMISGALAAVAGMIWLPLGRAVAPLPYGGLAWTLMVVRATATLPFASLPVGPFPTWSIWLVYAAVAVLWMGRNGAWARPAQNTASATPFSPRTRVLLWGSVALLALLPWWIGRHLPDGRLHLYALDVGQGDALLIVTPDGKQILVDGGPDPMPLLSQLGGQMPPWDRALELLVLTHADADHLGGLPELLARYQVAQVMDSGYPNDTVLYDTWTEHLGAQTLAPLVAIAGQRWQLGGGALLEVLAPFGAPFEELNENAVVLQLRYGAFCALLTGDIEGGAEGRLLKHGALGPCQVLKVAHHGSESSSTQPFLDMVRPTYALISAGTGNRYGHPHSEVIERLEGMGVRVFRTDEDGLIHLATDGEGLWVEMER
ncbi:MAG: ComEC/Rec2 family competence protein, partial [Ardenticatenaceae bacterium]